MRFSRKARLNSSAHVLRLSDAKLHEHSVLQGANKTIRMVITVFAVQCHSESDLGEKLARM